jgi:hypothetical protein
MEINFRKSMKLHLASLLKQQLAYWKQRGKIKWVTLGDENSRFFHAMASNKKKEESYSFSLTTQWRHSD